MAAPALAQGQPPPQARIAPAAGLRPLGDDARRVLEAIPDEGTPRPELHYFRSNEWRQDLLRPHLEGLGGAYVGVGSDQNYTMAAMARSELLLLVDYDPLIPWVHAIYRVLVSESETPQALIDRFSDEAQAETAALLERGLSDNPDRDRIVQHWRRRRGPWHAYLRRVQRLVRDGRPFSWLADPELYAYTRQLFRAGRIIAHNGDLTADGTVRAVGDAARRLGLTVRIVYFSNAEQFFPYTRTFVANMNALPTDERTVALRTIRHRSIRIADEGRWHYMVHAFPDFVSRMETGAYTRSFALTADLLAAGPPFLGRNGISTMTADTPRFVLSRAGRAGTQAAEARQ